MSTPETAAALALLNEQSTLALATTGPDGEPHIAPLFYLADDEFRLYWFSSPESVHSRNLEHDPRAAVTVWAATFAWQEIRGVQMRGTVRVVEDDAVKRAYVERFGLGNQFEKALAANRLYCFEPAWIRYLDNTRGFGFKCTVKG